MASELRFASGLAEASDAALVGYSARDNNPVLAIEMQRRLKDATERLTDETTESRESAERLGNELDASIASLTGELVAFRTSSDEAAGKLAFLTWVVIALTVVVAGLTAALLYLTVRGVPASPAPGPSQAARSASPSRALSAAPASRTPG